MEEEYHEKNAQLQYENFKLHEELALFKRLALSLEENYNLLSSTFLEKENHIKCLEQRLNEILEVLKDKDNLIASLESESEEYIDLNKKLEAKIMVLKQNSIERQKLFESKEEEFQQSFSILENKNKQLLSELKIKSEEATFRDATLRHMQQKNQELENEKLEILAMQERIVCRLNVENVENKEPTEEFVLSYHDYNMNRFDGIVLSEQNSLPYDSPSTNLKEEILEVEIQEKNRLIIHLKNTLVKKEEKINFALKLINELRTKMNQGGLLASNRRNHFHVDYSLFSDVINILLELIVWSENESEEKNEEEKRERGLGGEYGVETSLPSMPQEVFRENVVIETCSIASQTDPLETLSPVFGFRSSKERSSVSGKSDSEDHVAAPSVPYLTNFDQRRPLFHDHKTSNLDMDFFKMFEPMAKFVFKSGDSETGMSERKSISSHVSKDDDGISVKVEKARNRGMKSNEFPDEASACETFVRSCILIGKSKSTSSEEESNARFESMSFAFKTDAITFEKRLNLLKRKRDQAVTNYVAEVATIKNKLQEVQLSPVFDVDHFNAASGLTKELDFLLKAARQLVSSSEAYGYAQHEGRTLEFVTLMVEHVEKVEIQKKEILRFLNKLITDGEKSFPFLIGSPNEGLFQRKSPAGSGAPLDSGPGAWKRRASIATLPEAGSGNFERGKSISWSSSFRASANEKSSSKVGGNSICAGVNDESSAEGRGPSRRPKSTHFQILEGGMKEKFAVGPEGREFEEGAEGSASPPSGTSTKRNPRELDAAASSDFPRIPSFCHTTEYLNKLISVLGLKDSARQIFDCSEMAWRATRFRRPENVIDLIRFYMSWSLVFLMCLIFLGGFVAGLADCFIYLDLGRSFIWFAALSLFIFLRRFYRLFLGFALACLFALIAFVFWLAVSLPENLSARDIDNLLRFFGFVLEVRYLNGPPPI